MTHKQYAQAVFVRSRGTYFGGAITNKTMLTSGTKLEGKHTTVVIRRLVAIRINEPKLVTHFILPRTSGAYLMNNRYKLWFHSYMYMYLVHDYTYGLPHRASTHML